MPTATLTSAQIRQQFLDFFVSKHGHTAVPSAPVVPHNDPTLLFTNAGMNQFKPYFLGTEQPPAELGRRAVDTQKCIRAGGKHNDLDDVGKDSYHHTFFEMLGNWSFGDYFKKEAIDWAWELLVDQWGLDPERLHATYFEGDPSEGLEPDLEARDLWMQHLPAERVHPGNKKDNFWEMGDTGPCGPCSELHFDRSPNKDGGHLVNADDQDTVVEIWNLVFIQFNRSTDGKLSTLPDKHIDTGMGFERIVRILQGKTSNYDTDVFTPLFAAIEKVTGARPYDGQSDKTWTDPIDTAYRVIADHIRTVTFALSDGAHCGNKGRDAVLRTVLRRAVRYGHQTLGVEEPFFYKLVQTVVDTMGHVFPEIQKLIKAVEAELKEEEESFRKTLERGIVIFDKAVEGLKQGDTVDGDTAFDLEATYGFPISLTQVMAEERGLSVDMPGYEKAKDKHAEISRAGVGGENVGAQLVELVQQNDLPDAEFLGYGQTAFEGAVNAQSFDLPSAHVLVTDQTVFYGESGGQVGDTGSITWEGGSLTVTDTQKQGGVFFHIGTLSGQAAHGSVAVSMQVDADRRAAIENNHTGTHLLNRSLRDVVNPDAMQKGSLVDDSKLRFDFTQDAPIAPEQLAQVEAGVQADIAAGLGVDTQHAPQEKALQINGLRAVFGEKYPPMVRVVSVGPKVDELLATPDSADWATRSIEFCGGTHVANTNAIGQFAILAQEAVSKGVRRLVAVTGQAAADAHAQADALLERLSGLDEAPAQELENHIAEATQATTDVPMPLIKKQQIMAKVADLSQRVKAYQKAQGKKAAEAAIELARGIADAQSGPVITALIPGVDAAAIRPAFELITKRHSDAAVFLVGTTDDKVAMICQVPKDLIAQGLKAGDWVKHVAPIVQGGGGGKPDKAQAGGKDPSKAQDAVAAAEAFAKAALG